MKKLAFFFLLISINLCSQENLRDLLKKYHTENTNYISVDSLRAICKNVILLDAREEKEYTISHIKGAVFVGYEKFSLKKISKKFPNKDSTIVVYCSLGVRSGDIGKRLKEAGYRDVLNLYGGIFEWKNKGNNVFNSKGEETEKIHTYSHQWSKWLVKGEKVYE